MSSGSIALRAGRQGSWLILCTTILLAGCFALFAGSAHAATDWDGDGYADNDCAPLDPAVNPGATDKPDVAFEDTNCDGIDGDKADAIFVTLGGNDGAPGTLTNPKRTINAAITAAAAAGKDVYIAGGEYVESVNLADNVGIFGGYEPITGKRSAEQVTSIKGAPAALAFGDSGVVLQMLTLDGQQDGAGTAYGLRAVKDGANPSSVLLEQVIAKAAAADGNDGGFDGGTGFAGFGFGGGGGGFGGCGNAILGQLGAGGGGATGGIGGGVLGNNGGAGGSGATGGNGTNGTTGAPDAASWARTFAGTGSQGAAGGGGGGGRGGTGATLLSALCGGKGANGGSGGGGGFGGGGGLGGGGSFGAYLFDSSLVAVGSALQGGPGGTGGTGGTGGLGGGGLAPAAAGIGQCETFFVTICAENGFGGGSGGPGGRGGGGGGGAGGPSAGVFQAGPGSAFTSAGGTTLSHAAGGLGGLQGNGGATRGSSGQSLDVLRSGTAPASPSSDFDGDGMTDATDACPDVPRGTDANGDGCPDRPAKLVDANGNGIPDSAEASSNSSSGSGSGSAPTGGSGAPQGSPAPTPRVVAKLTAGFKATKTSTKVTKLIASALRSGDKVKVTCSGKGCAFKSKTVKAVGGKANMLTLFKKRALAPKAVVTVWITRAGAIGQVVKFTVGKGKAPKRTNMCTPVGKSKAQASC
jgi:hypothetical protein